MIGIYKITSPSNKIYVGSSNNINRRFSEYKSLNCKGQTRLYNSFKKYRVENHIFEILEECHIKSLLIRERYYQEFYETISKNGLNCKYVNTIDKLSKFSEETKLLM